MWTSFKKRKLELLESFRTKNNIDENVMTILDLINKNPCFVTSSSCSGRIVLLEISERKGDAKFYKKWHREIEFGELLDSLSDYHGRRKLWFRCEPFIIHVFAEDLDSAKELMRLSRKAGFKRGGIWGFKNNWPFLELIGTSEFSLPVFDGKILIAKEHLKNIIDVANSTLAKNYSQLERFEKELKSAERAG